MQHTVPLPTCSSYDAVCVCSGCMIFVHDFITKEKGTEGNGEHAPSTAISHQEQYWFMWQSNWLLTMFVKWRIMVLEHSVCFLPQTCSSNDTVYPAHFMHRGRTISMCVTTIKKEETQTERNSHSPISTITHQNKIVCLTNHCTCTSDQIYFFM